MSAADLRALATQLHRAAQIVASAAADADRLPRCEADLAKLLDELAEADVDRREHFARFPSQGISFDDQPADCREDWHRVMRRHDDAVRALVTFARARREASTPAAEEAA